MAVSNNQQPVWVILGSVKCSEVYFEIVIFSIAQMHFNGVNFEIEIIFHGSNACQMFITVYNI